MAPVLRECTTAFGVADTLYTAPGRAFRNREHGVAKKKSVVQIVMTAVVCCWAHLMTPTDPRKQSPVLGVSRDLNSVLGLSSASSVPSISSA